jgi:5-methyltetrahydrofolate--homocysteine methyltransferase
MQLPFVLQSAEVMKTAVKFLEPFMDKSKGESNKGVMVLATSKATFTTSAKIWLILF